MAYIEAQLLVLLVGVLSDAQNSVHQIASSVVSALHSSILKNSIALQTKRRVALLADRR